MVSGFGGQGGTAGPQQGRKGLPLAAEGMMPSEREMLSFCIEGED